MKIGISTASLYPMQTEQALALLGEGGVRHTEVFFNAASELEPPLLDELCRIRQAYDIRVASVHPFLSFGETYLLFSSYERRFHETLLLYDRYFEAANRLGADVLVIHGKRDDKQMDTQQYFERFGQLMERGRRAGIRVAQENVVQHFSQSPSALSKMAAALGEGFSVVLDTKQARRAGYTPQDFINAVGRHIVQVHLSDASAQADCLAPGEGTCDFAALFQALRQVGYNGGGVIELYRKNYGTLQQLLASLAFLQGLQVL